MENGNYTVDSLLLGDMYQILWVIQWGIRTFTFLWECSLMFPMTTEDIRILQSLSFSFIFSFTF